MKKLMNKKGFTLMEMLIVVAIIVILVAISIPVFTSQVGEAQKATNEANVRAAKAAAAVEYLTADTFTADTFYYDAADGKLEDENKGIAAYGKGTTAVAGVEETPDGKILEVAIAADGTVTLKWVTPVK